MRQHVVLCSAHSKAYSARSTGQGPSHLLHGRSIGGRYLHPQSSSDSAKKSVQPRTQSDVPVPEQHRHLHCQRDRMLTAATPTRAPALGMGSSGHRSQRPAKDSGTEVGRLLRRSPAQHLHRSAVVSGQRWLPKSGQQRQISAWRPASAMPTDISPHPFCRISKDTACLDHFRVALAGSSRRASA